MQWQDREGSANVEDRRGSGMGRSLVIGGGGGLATLVVLVVCLVTGIDPGQVLQSAPSASGPPMNGPTASTEGGAPPANDEQARFVSVVLKDTEDAWHQILPPLGHEYTNPHLVLFSDSVDSACGMASAAVGPFYCPRDSKVYLDMSFFRELDQRFGAPGDFARAYVIAHEVGHHVQNLLGISTKVEERQQAAGSKAEANQYSVRLELQADCFAGIWGHAASQGGRFSAGHVELEPGDADEALRAAAAIGDDRLQRMATGRIQPERFTHGTSQQRVEWFRRGMESGDPRRCDTFSQLTH